MNHTGHFLWAWMAPLLLCGVSLAAVAGCSKAGDGAVANSADASTATSVEEPADPESYPVPDGNAAQLLEYINEMALRAPQGATADEQTVDLGRIMDARIRAAEKILGGPEADSYGGLAKRTKLESIRVLANIGRVGATDDHQAYAAELASSPDEETARIGRYGNFFVHVDELMVNPNADPDKIVAAIKSLIDQEPHDHELLGVTDEAANTLAVTGYRDAAMEATQVIGAAFVDHEDPEIAKRAAEVVSRAKLIAFERAFEQIMRGVAGADEALLKRAEELLAESPSSASLGMVMDVTQRIENAMQLDLASQLYDRLTDAVGTDESPDEMITLIQSGLKRANTRLNLVGNEVELGGVTALGKELDWSDFQDKVVLIDFWATWCGPCLEELPNIRENYDRFHSQGFEVVGVNLDEDKLLAEKFIEQQELPWPTLLSTTEGKPNEIAERLGVETIPFMVLVGRDGKVIDVHVRGQRLGELLTELFEADDAVLELEMEEPIEEAEDAVLELEMEEPIEEADDAVLELEMEEPIEEADDVGEDEAGEDEAAAPAADESAARPHRKTLWIAVAQVAEQPDSEQPLSSLTDEESGANPYEPEAGLSVKELVAFILEMEDKTSSIQYRDGFRQGICVAADRVLNQPSPERARIIAAEAKLKYLHRDACLGDEEADQELVLATKALAGEQPEQIQSLVKFFDVERVVIVAAEEAAEKKDQPWDGKIFEQSLKYLADQADKLTSRHLRMASSLVELLNANLDEEARETGFDQLSELLTASSDKALQRYGRRIAAKPAGGGSQMIGKPLELAGTTIDGDEFSADDVRGKVVIVDFWATWCGPCRAALPELQAIYEKHQAAGLEIVGVSLDHDTDALAEYLEDNRLPWIHIVGESSSAVADIFQIRGIPAAFLVDQSGKIVAHGRTAGEFEDQITQLLSDK